MSDFSLIVKLAADSTQYENTMKTAAQRSRQFAQEAKAMFEATRTPAERFRDAITKVSDAYAQGRVDLETYQRSIERLQDEYNGTTSNAERLKAAGQRVFREMMTPLEQYRAQVADLNNLLRAGAINQQTFNRARAAATTQLSNSGQGGTLNAQATAIFNATRTAGERYGATIQHLNTLLAAGRISQDTYTRAVNQARTALNAGVSPVRQFASSMLGFSTGVGAAVIGAQMAINAIEALGHAAAGAAIHGLKLAADFEQAEVAFGTVFKSATAAKQVMAEIQQFAAATPFEFPELKDAAVKLAGFGTSAQQVVPTLKMLGDIAAGTGTTVGELAETYGKARVQGRAYTRDVNEFANRGVPIWEALAKTLGTTKDKIHGMVEEGKVGFPELQRALVSLTQEGGMYEGATERQSKTLLGLYSTLRDNVNLTLAEIGESISKELSLKDATKELIEFTGIVKNELTPTVIDFAKGAAMLSKGTEPLLRMMTGMDTLKESIQASHEAMLRWKLAAAAIFGGGGAADLGAQHFFEMAELQKQRAGASSNVGGVKIETDAGKESRDLAEAAAAFNAKMKEQIATLGMASDAAELYKLKQQGLKGEALAQAEALIKQKQAQEELAKTQKQAQQDAEAAAKKQADAEKALLDRLNERIATLKRGREMNDVEKYEKEFGKPASAAAKAAQAQADAMEDIKRRKKELDDEEKRSAEEARRIIESQRTPLEKYEDEIAKIRDLWQQGLLDEEQTRRAVRNAQDEFINATGGTGEVEHTSENKALLRGTAEAFSAVNRANDKKKQEKILEDQLTIQKRQEIIQRQQLAAQQNVAAWRK